MSIHSVCSTTENLALVVKSILSLSIAETALTVPCLQCLGEVFIPLERISHVVTLQPELKVFIWMLHGGPMQGFT